MPDFVTQASLVRDKVQHFQDTAGPVPDFVTRASGISELVLWWFVETSLVVSALAALAVLASRVRWITPGPAARHALWLMVMVKLVTPPLLHWPWSVPSPVAISRQEPSRPCNEISPGGDRVLAEGQLAGSGDEGLRVAVPIGLTGSLAIENAPDVEGSAPGHPEVPGHDPGIDHERPTFLRGLGLWVASAWLVGSIVLGVGQARRVCRFRRLLLEATPAPAWLTEEAGRIGRRLAVRVPPILVVPGLGTPLLWCLGRPLLLVPGGLLKSLKSDRWRAIVAHELAHLRRGDHWVRRLELAAGLVWWWNPLYQLARRRLDFEAELACDAWAVWASPDGRISYAESLIRICATLSSTESPAPALGVAGNGRSFERRLRMILHDRVDRRVSVPSLLVASLLACLALPSWTTAGPAQVDEKPTPVVTIVTEPVRTEATAPVVSVDAVTTIVPAVTVAVEAVSRVDVIDDDDDDKDDAEQKAKAKAKEAKLKAEKSELDAIQAKKQAVAKEMEKKFGPGSDFAKKMEAMGKEMEEQFGPNSEFAKKMKSFEKEMQAKFGPGSEFAKDMEKKFGPDSEFAKGMKGNKEAGQAEARSEAAKAKLKAEAQARAEAAKVRAEAQKARAEEQKARIEDQKARAKARADARVREQSSPESRTRRIEALESRIDEMLQELKRLKAEASSDKEAAKP
jgi:beta-lactamase regulating signal transducer with metallopeptidase domain